MSKIGYIRVSSRQTPFTAVSVSMKSVTVSPSRPQLDRLTNGNVPQSRSPLRSGKLYRLKRKSPQKRLQSVSGSFRLFVSIGFVPVVVCSTILIMTYAERKTGVPLGYGHSA